MLVVGILGEPIGFQAWLPLDSGTRMVRHYDTTQSAHDIIRMIVGNHPVTLPHLTLYVRVFFCSDIRDG